MRFIVVSFLRGIYFFIQINPIVRAYALSMFLMCLVSCSVSNSKISTDTPLIVSYPISLPVEIDGVLDEWDESLPKYPINTLISGDELLGENDLKGLFQTAYDAKSNQFFLAVQIWDYIQGTQKGECLPDSIHSYSLFLDEQHHENGSGIVQFKFSRNGVELENNLRSWDPLIDSYSSTQKIQFEMRHEKGKTIIEIGVKLNDSIYHNRVLGLGHLIYDIDIQKERVVGMIGRNGKGSNGQPGKIGMMLLTHPETPLISVSGKVSWADSAISIIAEGVKIRSMTTNNWYYFPTEMDGSFFAMLPPDQYLLLPGKTKFFNGDEFYKVNGDRGTKFEVSESARNEPILSLKPMEGPPQFAFNDLLFRWKNQNKSKIDSVINSFMEYFEIEGAAFAAYHQGRLVYSNSYGFSNAYSLEKVTDHTLFEVASMTKPVFAFLILKLVEKGILDLDVPLSEYYQDPLNQFDQRVKFITARHVLSHQTGLPNWLEEVDNRMKFNPGEGFGYSGEGYEYLKRVVEQLTKKDIDLLLHEEVIAPLGLENFYFKDEKGLAFLKSHGHLNGYPGLIDLPESPWVAGCLMTTASSYLKFLQSIKKRDLLKPETYNLFFSEQLPIPEEYRESNWNLPEYMALGIFVEDAPYGKVLRHSGNNGDFDAMFRLYDDLDMAYVILTNGNSGFYLTNELERFLIDPELFE